MDHLLTIPEELFLLTVNDRTGRRAFLKSKKFDILLSAAILMDLALHNRIDSDLDHIIPDLPEPTGHPLLDLAMEQIRQSQDHQKINWWLLRIEQLARMDLIGKAVSKSLREVTRSIMGGMRAKEIFGFLTPEEKLEEMVEVMKTLMHIDLDRDMPEWLRKGTQQYEKTLDYIRKTGTSEIVFNSKTGQYGLKAGAGHVKIF
jgi:hypothetical protein